MQDEKKGVDWRRDARGRHFVLLDVYIIMCVWVYVYGYLLGQTEARHLTSR